MTGVTARKVGARYNGTPVLSDVDLSAGPGEWLVVIGPNGAGKTSLLRVLAGVLAATGEVLLDGTHLTSMRRRDIAARVAVVPQIPVIPDGVTVFDYVMLGRTPYIPYWRLEGPEDRRRVRDVLTRLDLEKFGSRPIASLSGGERQRAVLARALAQDASVLLLDEPTTALDLGHQQQVLELVDALRHEHGLIVISTLHDLTFAAQFGDRVVLLVDGRVVAEGSPQAVLQADILAAHFGAAVEVVTGSDGPVLV
ncbi:MAG: ABC transporter ATP-binding protein, partial [Acidimicrobiia bacterium]|nr:ABC transporter ATP-binding protein [Acidimicrobiia bacterium]